jgi:hypothetical protein
VGDAAQLMVEEVTFRTSTLYLLLFVPSLL